MYFLAQHVQGHMAAQCHLRNLRILQGERDLVTGPMKRDVVQHIPSHETLDDTREPLSAHHPLFLLKKKNKSSPNDPYFPKTFHYKETVRECTLSHASRKVQTFSLHQNSGTRPETSMP